ncbi:MAG: hypothetical protein HC794_01295 [Nitrospiraceae bacterium]|nr:hypothetical protein [Nitrospiraceae bacterium]
MKKPKQVGQINPKSTVEATGVDSPVDEGIVPFDHHKPFALETLHTCPILSAYRRRFITNATHPASNPPPMSVVPK